MCGLCGLLGGDAHWSESAGIAADRASTQRAERHARVSFLNGVLAAFGCTVSDWQGSVYMLATHTGKTELVSNLPQLWQAVERLTGHRADPLAAGMSQRVQGASPS